MLPSDAHCHQYKQLVPNVQVHKTMAMISCVLTAMMNDSDDPESRKAALVEFGERNS